ncbi:MAG: Ig-like domain-containing protein, partial [Candidatus Portnoybacteria bacterium]|nr:Ig-like domain-containing protein [Candidatus Portnoybacteria bacterium]
DGYEKIILLAHHPFRKDYWQELYDLKMYNIGFSDKELTAMHESLVPYWDQIYALFAGHTHENKEYSFTGDLLKIVETDANVDGPLARLAQFYPDGRIDYSKMLGNAMQITAHSPIDLEIIDPDGLIINKLMNEISGASYFEEDIDGDGDSEDLIEIAERKEGNYQIRAIPGPDALPDETYSLDISLLEDNFGYTPIVLAQDVPVSQIPSEPYNFEAQQRVVASLVYNGDLFSQYSDSVNLSAVLNDANNNPLAGKSIVFKIGEQTVSALTDSDGIANASLVLNQIPGQYYLVETGFSGDENYLPAADIKDFEILKEDTNINILEKEGFVFDDIILEAEVKDGDGQTLLQEAEVEFKIDNRGLGMAQVGEAGIATSSWQADLIPEESTEIYPIQVIFAGNDYYEPAQGQASFILKSAKWLKQDAVARLDNIDVSDKKLNSEILAAENLIQDSLADDLWLDSSHIIFFDRECLGQNESAVDLERIGVEALFETGKLANISQKCFQLKSGLKVFGNEYLAIRRLQEKNSGKQKTPEELKTIFNQVIGELVKADKLLAKVAIYDAENAPVIDSKFEKNVEWRINESKKSLAKAEEAILRGRPDKAIIEFAHSWLYAQIALRFAD